MEILPAEFLKLTESVLGERPVHMGQAFNLHYRTQHAFIKVTYPWVKGDRMKNEVKTAQFLGTVGVDASVSLTREPLSFEDETGRERWATFWEPVEDVIQVSQDVMTYYCTQKMLELSLLEVPRHATKFTLEDFMDAVKKRMQISDSDLVPFLLREAEAVLERFPSYELPSKFIHGDVHSGNLLVTSGGRIVLVDLESSCEGPMEWDAAQISRYCSLPGLLELYKKFESWGLDVESIRYFHHVRNLTSLTHMVASKSLPPMYWKSLKEVTENSLQKNGV